MGKILLAAFTAATVLSGGLSAGRAAAMSPAATSALSTAADAGLVREATMICGNNGCLPVQTKAPQKRKFQTLGHG